MQLQNDFPPYIKSLFASVQPYCQKCGSNQQCAIHHIYGRTSSALFNGITLCHDCHRVADGFNTDGIKVVKVQRDLLLRTMVAFLQNPWWDQYMPKAYKEINNDFLNQHPDDFDAVARQLLR